MSEPGVSHSVVQYEDNSFECTCPGDKKAIEAKGRCWHTTIVMQSFGLETPWTKRKEDKKIAKAINAAMRAMTRLDQEGRRQHPHSILAWYQGWQNGKLKCKRDKILDDLCRNGRATRLQIESRTGIQIYTVCGQVRLLLDEGYLEVTGMEMNEHTEVPNEIVAPTLQVLQDYSTRIKSITQN